jgi:hypothetical protein
MAIDQEAILRSFLTTIAAWQLSPTDAGQLIGVKGSAVTNWQSGVPLDVGEDVIARMMMVARIRTALDICWSAPLCNEWIALPNKGALYGGRSPLAYIADHGWPGLFWVLCQAQARAVGN